MAIPFTAWQSRPRYLSLAALLLVLGASGCSDRQSAGGRVLFDDGTPLEEGMVVCEMKAGDKPVMARGAIQRDGTFQLGTVKPGDGAPAGTYRVLVTPRSRTEAERRTTPPLIDPKFEK